MEKVCPFCQHDTVIKRGFYRPKSNRYQPIHRFQCKAKDCGKTFSRQTNAITRGQKKPFLNQEILKWYASGTTLRRIAKVMGINKKTVVHKFWFMAQRARKIHEQKLAAGKLRSSYIQIDEQETFEHTKYRPLAIALAVDAGDGTIIEAQVARFGFRATQHLPLKYKDDYRPDNRSVALEDCVRSIKTTLGDDGAGVLIESDKTTHYSAIIRKFLPKADYQKVEKMLPSYLSAEEKKKMRKPLFWVNHICARIRHDLSRMARKTWVTTKKMEGLQAHLDLYIAFNNGYDVC